MTTMQSNESLESRPTDPQIMTAVFRDVDSAERAYNGLRARGYTDKDISVLMSDETRKAHFGNSDIPANAGAKAAEGAGVGSAIGGAAGAILATVVAIAAPVVLPGVGLIVSGPLVALLAGAGAGGLAGGLIGSFVGLGLSHEQAQDYEAAIRAGGIVLGVRPRSNDDARYFEQTWVDAPPAFKVY